MRDWVKKAKGLCKEKEKKVFTPPKKPGFLLAGCPTAKKKIVSAISGRYETQGAGRLIDLPRVAQLVIVELGLSPTPAGFRALRSFHRRGLSCRATGQEGEDF